MPIGRTGDTGLRNALKTPNGIPLDLDMKRPLIVAAGSFLGP